MISTLKMTLLSVIGALVASLILAVTSTTAQASSIYDSYVVTTNDLELWSDQTSYPCSSTGYQHVWGNDWQALVSDEKYWAFGNQIQFHDDYFDAFEDAVATGGVAVLNYYNDGTDKDKGVLLRVIYSPSGLDANWSSSGANFTASDNSDLYVIDFQVFRNGGCEPRAWQPTREGMSWFGYSGNTNFKMFLATGQVDMNYPGGYQGSYVPTTLPITGTVDCGGVNPSLMTIAQSGNNGAATLTYVSLGIAEWSYDLRTDVPYSFNVLCGTKLAAPFGVVSATTSSNLWTCDVVGPEPWYCVLS
jgi:hypothetical protein